MIRHQLGRHVFPHVVLIGIFLIPAATAVAVFTARTRSLFDPAGCYLATSGGEPVSIYNILKLQRGLTLYEDPRDPPYYPTTLYNAGFYHLYAAATWPFRHDLPRLVLAMRLVTLGHAGVGLAALISFAVRVWNRRAPGRNPRLVVLVMSLAAVATFLGPLPGWWVLTVRPDLGAAVFAGCGLLLVLGLGAERPRLVALLAGLCLAAAWSFKQSSVLIAAGLGLAALVRRRYLPAGLILLPIGITAGACLLVLGPDYRANVVWATSLPTFAWHNLGRMALQVMVKGGFPLVISGVSLALLPLVAWIHPEERWTLTACWFTTLLGGVIACCRTGSEANYFFELWVVVTLLAMIGAKHLADSTTSTTGFPQGHRALILVLAVLALGSAGLDAARLAAAGGGRLGKVRLALDADQRSELERAAVLASRAGGDVYCQPALSGLAWDPPLPAPIFDDYVYFHQPAARRGLLRGPGLEGLLARYQYPLVILEPDNQRMLAAATAAGYVRQPGWSRLAVLTPPPSDPAAPR